MVQAREGTVDQAPGARNFRLKVHVDRTSRSNDTHRELGQVPAGPDTSHPARLLLCL